MKVLALSVCVLLTLNLAAVRAADSDAAAAEKEIKARAEEFSAAWKKHDAAALAGFYTTDGELVTGQGQSYAGRERIEELLKDAFDGSLKETTFKWTVEKVKLVKPDVAIVDYEAEIKGADANAEGMKFHIVAVMVKQGGKWVSETTRGIMYAQ